VMRVMFCLHVECSVQKEQIHESCHCPGIEQVHINPLHTV
jgi:hypothetical protein